MQSEDYLNGVYLRHTGGTWHAEDSPFKVNQVLKMLTRHPGIHPRRICEVGAGAGGILADLQSRLPDDVDFTGYEISPQAHALSLQRANARCHFILGDAFSGSQFFDLALIMDVIEHVEDCFLFMRQASRLATWKIYHVPLDAHCSGILRGTNAWSSVGHLHLFTLETALKSIEHSGQTVCDWFLTDGILHAHHPRLRTRMANRARRSLRCFGPRLIARLLGGYSVLILAR